MSGQGISKKLSLAATDRDRPLASPQVIVGGNASHSDDGVREAEITDVSIIVCTRNRSEHLSRLLEQISRLPAPADWDIEVLVVDNGSTDATPAVAMGAPIPGMSVRHILEPRAGKGYAYNTGLAAARGRAFLLTDDDTQPQGGWIEGMCGPILRGEADAVQGGVRIAEHLERPWLRGVLRVWVAAVEDPTEPPEGLVGANMAFSREVWNQVGPFDVRLGPGAAGFFDDTIFGWAVEQRSFRIAYRPDVLVEHHFEADRLTVGAFMTAADRMAKSRLIALGPEGPATLRKLAVQAPGLALRTLTQMVRFVLRREPDPGFLSRYYRLCCWRAARSHKGTYA